MFVFVGGTIQVGLISKKSLLIRVPVTLPILEQPYRSTPHCIFNRFITLDSKAYTILIVVDFSLYLVTNDSIPKKSNESLEETISLSKVFF